MVHPPWVAGWSPTFSEVKRLRTPKLIGAAMRVTSEIFERRLGILG
jgi:hypothetical protein